MNFSSLSNQAKIDALKTSKLALEQEIYTTLIRLNIDPDTFVMSEWQEPVPVSTHEQHRLTELIEAIQFTLTKLSEFE